MCNLTDRVKIICLAKKLDHGRIKPLGGPRAKATTCKYSDITHKNTTSPYTPFVGVFWALVGVALLSPILNVDSPHTCSTNIIKICLKTNLGTFAKYWQEGGEAQDICPSYPPVSKHGMSQRVISLSVVAFSYITYFAWF